MQVDASLYIRFTWSRFNPLSLATLPYAKVSALYFYYFISILQKIQENWVKIWRVFEMQGYWYTQNCFLAFWLQPQVQEEGSSPQGSSKAENPLGSYDDTQGASGSNITKGRLLLCSVLILSTP